MIVPFGFCVAEVLLAVARDQREAPLGSAPPSGIHVESCCAAARSVFSDPCSWPGAALGETMPSRWSSQNPEFDPFFSRYSSRGAGQ